MSFDARHSIDHGFRLLARRLDPLISERLAPELDGLPWTEILVQVDFLRGRRAGHYSTADPHAGLRMVTEKLGSLNHPFSRGNASVRTVGSQLRVVRNKYAHYEDFDTFDAVNAHFQIAELLHLLGDDEGAREAGGLRRQAISAYQEEFRAEPPTQAQPAPKPEPVAEDELTSPDAGMFTRSGEGPKVVANEREAFEPWAVAPVAGPEVLDSLRAVRSKQLLRAVATEIVDVEGPIHLDRLVQLTAMSFGLRRVQSKRKRSIVHQLKQSDLLKDEDGFIWPADIDPETWREFRPNDSTVDRDFTQIAPREIANAIQWVRQLHPGATRDEVEAETLRTFGRGRRSQAMRRHLDRAWELV